MSEWKHKHLLDLQDTTRGDIELILETARSFKEVSSREIKKVPALRGKTVAMLFAEPSTRTRVSFELAAKRLSADTLTIQAAVSSLAKGETLLDTALNVEAMNVDLVVVRHQASGAPQILANGTKMSVVNAGDGCRSHPTQALLDIFTIHEKLGRTDGVRVAIVGDIMHSRVARSNISGLIKMGASVVVCGPSTLLPVGIEQMGVESTTDITKALKGADVVMALRMQKERQQDSFLPSIAEYVREFCITPERLKLANHKALVMHPGPTNRGIEIAAEVADGPQSVILEQVTNGIAVRMAVLYLLLGRRAE
ncbi:MAG: aspartate carbamoyltransferase catalytic subunit [Candidatus Omnitrophica bacterium]|nr:aspartate carbamoyltransferase catalytic subunit [Candidatus Omnitrophota bacterium]